MRNPATFVIESWVGGVFVLIFSMFFIGLFFIALKNFDSDNLILSASANNLKNISSSERELIDEWVSANNPGLSVQEVGYRFIIKKYPDKPWLKK